MLCAAVWSTLQLRALVRVVSPRALLDSRVNQDELALIVYVSLLVLAVLLIVVTLHEMVRRRTVHIGVTSVLNVMHQKEVLIATLLAVIPRPAESTVKETTPKVELPIRAVVEPFVALVLIHRVLQRRRRELRKRVVPQRLTEESARRLYELQAHAVTANTEAHHHLEIDEEDIEKELNELLIEEAGGPQAVEAPHWDVVIRVYGYPSVENRSGECAQFGKRRSLEVLSWLSMNKDRPRRSAVRTAVWDVEITDATFSTILSDVRRGLSDVVTHRSRHELLPPTFTDVIELGVSLTTDFDLLNTALGEFRADQSCAVALVRELDKIRDIPFAGANYMWADLDGTTTRMVVTALQASIELATWAKENGDVSMCMVAIKAGLRVMPGCEELLAIQQSFISDQSMSRHGNFR